MLVRVRRLAGYASWRHAVAACLLVALVLAAATLATPTGRACNTHAPQTPSAEGQRLIETFTTSHPPLVAIDIAALYGAEGRRALLDPGEALPTWHRHPYDQAALLARYARSCRPEDAPPGVAPTLQKAFAWQRFDCAARSGAPAAAPERALVDDAFFEAPPFMHPSGRSFVALAAPRRGPAWVAAHARELHVTEIASANVTDPALRVLGELSWTALRAVLRGDDLVQDDRWLLVRAERREGPLTAAVLEVFPRASWSEYARRATVTLAPRGDGSRCGAPATPDLCWQVPPPTSLRAAGIGSILSLAIAGVALGVARVRARRHALEDRAWILRTLTHEMRTPATSLALGLEPLRRAYDEIPPALQEPLLRVCDDGERIQRVLAVSASWLSLHEPGAEPPVAIERIGTPAAVLTSIVEGYGAEVTVEAPASDRPLSTDPRWLRIAIKNLVDNALAHGRPPVRVVARWERRGLAVDVVDAGDTRGASIAELAAAFHKGASSTGLGLGLAIVARAARTLGGELEHRAEPTTFTLRIADRTPGAS